MKLFDITLFIVMFLAFMAIVVGGIGYLSDEPSNIRLGLYLFLGSAVGEGLRRLHESHRRVKQGQKFLGQ